jgi:hypothetical protein
MTVKVTGFTIEDALEAKTRFKMYKGNEIGEAIAKNPAAGAVISQQSHNAYKNESAKPRTKIGSEALRSFNIDLDTVNYAFDRAMKHSHG